jgi:hypothetical protein
MRNTLFALATVVLLLSMSAWAGQEGRETDRHTASGQQWEYLVVAGGSLNLSPSGNDRLRKAPDGSFTREAFPLERNLDKLGALGWELVSVTGSSQDPVFYLKRPKQ